MGAVICYLRIRSLYNSRKKSIREIGVYGERLTHTRLTLGQSFFEALKSFFHKDNHAFFMNCLFHEFCYGAIIWSTLVRHRSLSHFVRDITQNLNKHWKIIKRFSILMCSFRNYVYQLRIDAEILVGFNNLIPFNTFSSNYFNFNR